MSRCRRAECHVLTVLPVVGVIFQCVGGKVSHHPFINSVGVAKLACFPALTIVVETMYGVKHMCWNEPNSNGGVRTFPRKLG